MNNYNTTELPPEIIDENYIPPVKAPTEPETAPEPEIKPEPKELPMEQKMTKFHEEFNTMLDDMKSKVGEMFSMKDQDHEKVMSETTGKMSEDHKGEME